MHLTLFRDKYTNRFFEKSRRAYLEFSIEFRDPLLLYPLATECDDVKYLRGARIA